MVEKNNFQLFGIPFSKSKINSDLYNKEQIVSSIEKNYEIDPTRNRYNHDEKFKSRLHHAVNDFNNENFHEIDFSLLLPIYQKKIEEFLFQIKFKNDSWKYEFKIVNYTCMSQGDFLQEHDHLTSAFVAVHYLKFEKSSHAPTLYTNPLNFANFLKAQSIGKNFKDFDLEHIENSWLNPQFYIDVEEDDIVISPGLLRHQVFPSESDQLRMTIAINIDIL